MLWVRYVDAQGIKKKKTSGFAVGHEAEARRTWELLKRQIAAERELAGSLARGDAARLPTDGVTVAMYADHWLPRREKDKPHAAAENEWQLRRYIRPMLGTKKLADLRPRDVLNFVRELRAKRDEHGQPALAPRTVRAIYSGLRAMLQDATMDELIASNPCQLRRGDLPAIADKDPTWRSGAVYSREEVEQLISDPRIPEERRVLNALLFLTGSDPARSPPSGGRCTTPRSNL